MIEDKANLRKILIDPEDSFEFQIEFDGSESEVTHAIFTSLELYFK